jgi:hypothetical protein
LRKEHFKRFEPWGLEPLQESGIEYQQVVRSAIHITSKLVGHFCLSFLSEAVPHVIEAKEVEMVNLFYGACRELGGANPDIYPKRMRAIHEPYFKLWRLLAKDAPAKELDQTRQDLATLYVCIAMYESMVAADDRDRKAYERGKSSDVSLESTPEDGSDGASQKKRRLRITCESWQSGKQDLFDFEHIPANDPNVSELLESDEKLEYEKLVTRLLQELRLQERSKPFFELLAKYEGDVEQTAAKAGVENKVMYDKLKTFRRRIKKLIESNEGEEWLSGWRDLLSRWDELQS